MEKVKYRESEEPIVLSKHLIDLLLSQPNPGELLALYTFYYYTAKWQKTNQPHCTNSYVSTGLLWGIDKVEKYKARLKKLGLIENVIAKNDRGQITGYYIYVNFIWSKEKVDSLLEASARVLPVQEICLSRKNTPPNALNTNNIKRNTIPPSLKDVKKYCKKRGGIIDPNQFFDWNTAKGWKMGKEKMKDWQAAVRTWESREKANGLSKQEYKPSLFKPEYKENAGVRYYLNTKDGEYYHKNGDKYID